MAPDTASQTRINESWVMENTRFPSEVMCTDQTFSLPPCNFPDISVPNLQSQEEMFPSREPYINLVESGEKVMQEMWASGVSGFRTAVTKVFDPDDALQT
jgi:hypothetical protein